MEVMSDSSQNADAIQEQLDSSHSIDPVNSLNLSTCQITEFTVEEQRAQIITRGLSGLINLGNTCYMNACLQCLSATEILVAYFYCKMYKKDLQHGIIRTLSDQKRKKTKKSGEVNIKYKDMKDAFKNSLMYRFRNLLIVMWGANCKLKPRGFKDKLGDVKKSFANHNQHDSHECIDTILDALHEESKTDVVTQIVDMSPRVAEYQDVKQYYSRLVFDNLELTEDEKVKLKNEFNIFRSEHLREDAKLKSLLEWQKFLKKNHSVIIDIFTGLYFTELKCHNCLLPSFTFETFTCLNPSVPEGREPIQLDELMSNDFNQIELMTGETSYN
jgi:ubiquitin C-terminal hydrolase